MGQGDPGRQHQDRMNLPPADWCSLNRGLRNRTNGRTGIGAHRSSRTGLDGVQEAMAEVALNRRCFEWNRAPLWRTGRRAVRWKKGAGRGWESPDCVATPGPSFWPFIFPWAQASHAANTTKPQGAILPQGANDLAGRRKEKHPPRGSTCGGLSKSKGSENAPRFITPRISEQVDHPPS